MKVKATVNLNDLGYTLNKDIQVAICDMIFDIENFHDCVKPDITLGFGVHVCDEPKTTFIMRGDPASVKCGVGAILDAVECSIYPFDKFDGELEINITTKKEDS